MDKYKLETVRIMQTKDYIKYSAIYLIIYFIVIGILMAAFAANQEQVAFQVDTFTVVTKIFLFVLGAVNFGITFKDYILQGVTRKEFCVGTLYAIATLCILFTLLLTVMYVITRMITHQYLDPVDTAILMIASLLLFYAYFIIGWFIGMSFLKYRIIGGTMSIVIALVCIVIMEITTSIGFMSLVGDLDLMKPTSIPLIYNLLSTVIICFLITYFVYSKTKKLYFKLK